VEEGEVVEGGDSASRLRLDFVMEERVGAGGRRGEGGEGDGEAFFLPTERGEEEVCVCRSETAAGEVEVGEGEGFWWCEVAAVEDLR
jgi:hypothetical protein